MTTSIIILAIGLMLCISAISVAVTTNSELKDIREARSRMYSSEERMNNWISEINKEIGRPSFQNDNGQTVPSNGLFKATEDIKRRLNALDKYFQIYYLEALNGGGYRKDKRTGSKLNISIK